MIVSQFESTLDAYSEERAILVKSLAFFAKLLGHTTGYAFDKDAPQDTSFTVFIDLPTGQVSFHIREKWVQPYFEDMLPYPSKWDNHTREERNKRLANLH